MPKTVQEWLDQVQKYVGYCYNCQPYDHGESFWIQGDKISVYDFLCNKGVPGVLIEAVANGLKCDNCGEDLSLYVDIGIKPEYEILADSRRDEWESSYKSELTDFTNYLEKYSYLGSSHEIGSKILNKISNFPKAEHIQEKWWRSRLIESSRNFQIAIWGHLKSPSQLRAGIIIMVKQFFILRALHMHV